MTRDSFFTGSARDDFGEKEYLPFVLSTVDPVFLEIVARKSLSLGKIIVVKKLDKHYVERREIDLDDKGQPLGFGLGASSLVCGLR